MQAVHHSLCADRRRLAEQFATAAREYSEAVIRAMVLDPAGEQDNDVLHIAVSEAEERSRKAGLEYEHHVQTHRCAESIEGSVSALAVSA